jgi:choline dehydrogenase
MDSYDYIIVGSGSAGGVLANRLSADPRRQVLLLEAGPASHWLSPIPIGVAKLVDDPAANWCYESLAQGAMAGRRLGVPRGRLLGGSSAINGLVFVRGQAEDYDTWAQMGNRGWSYADVLPAFKSLECYAGGTDATRGRDGALLVTEADDKNLLYDALRAAGRELGIADNPDYNGANQEGVVTAQTTIANGRRMSVARCFLEPVKRRPNLHIVTKALARRLLFDGRRCCGVEYQVGDARFSAQSRAEVVLSAGAINSPQLLELSGIGQAEILKRHGIEVRHALAGVGENLRDHLSPRMGWGLSAPRTSYNDRARGLGLLWQVVRYAATRRGFLSLPTAPILAFLKSREGLMAPDIQLHFMPYTYTADRKLHKRPGMTVVLYQMRPESRGCVHLGGADPLVEPTIDFNFLATELDRRTTISAVRWTRKLVNTQALGRVRGDEFKPGAQVETDDQILDWVRATAETAYHPVGTCKMGQDPLAVVDSRLRVHGVSNLRVADASIMPTLVSGNTNAACMMIGERAAQMIIEDETRS